MVGAKVFAYDIAVKNADGVTIYYDYIYSDYYGWTPIGLEVTSSGEDERYSGSVNIPRSVIYNGKTYQVTRINYDAFYFCRGLTSVTIPSSVKSIGREAFYGCSGLTSVYINSLLVWCSIEFESYTSNPLYYAKHLFINNEEIKDLIINSRVTSIGDYAFYGFSGLTSVTIPSSVTSIGDEAFYGCSGLTSMEIHCKTIGSWFKNTAIKTIIIGDEVESIGDEAFYGCSDLTSVTIPTNVISIGNNAFSKPKKVIWLTNTPPTGYRYAEGVVNYVANDLYTGLSNKTVYPFLSSLFEVDGVKYVPVSPSERTCDAIDCVYNSSAENIHIGTTVSYKGVDMTVNNVKPYICCNNDFIKDVNLTFNGNLGDYAFYGCKGIQTLTVSNKGSIANAFQNCMISGNIVVSNAGDIGNSAFSSISGKFTASINNAGSIGQDAFKGCTGLTSLEIGNNVTGIKSNAFNGCTGLTSLVIGNNVTGIGSNAFQNCTNMTTATIGNKVNSIGSYAFSGCSALRSVIIPNPETILAMTTLGEYAFENCKNMVSVQMGASVKVVNQGTFFNCSSLNNLQIGNNVTTIHNDAFKGCSALPLVKIPQSVTSIGDYVFSGCKKLKTVIMEDRNNNQALTLGSNGSNPIFADCPLDSVYIGRNISYSTNSSKGYSPFYRNTSLRSVTITDKETEISENEFYGCTNLKNVRIGDGVTTIGNWAFSGCSSLDFFSFGSSVKTIGKEAFSDCTAMTKLISHAYTPPECGSQALDDINKWNCTLIVPIGYTSAYQKANQWKEFFFIEEASAIRGVTNAQQKPVSIYDLNGHRQKDYRNGINILRMSDGTTKKVMVK